MNVEFKTKLDDHDILFAAEFPMAPRVGEIVWWPPNVNKRYRILAVEYGILDFQGRNVGAICTVKKVEGDRDE